MLIIVREVKIADDISISCVVNRHSLESIQQRLTARGDRIQILRKFGIADLTYKIYRRPVLATVTILIVFLSVFLPTRILFVEVEGNSAVPANYILEQAAAKGICFGAARRYVKSERVKNAILSAVPDLQWIGVNTSGCVAKISVKERNSVEPVRTEKGFVSNMVATQDGVITECTVRHGNCLCKVGQAVTRGELLVSGYTDCGVVVRTTYVDAEIVADTLHMMKAVTHGIYTFRVSEYGRERQYSLLIGKKLINFFKDSGISDTTCVKMYERKYLTLPGGMSLPIAVIVEEHIYYETDTALLPEESGNVLLTKTVQDYLRSSMVSGRINNADILVQAEDTLYRLTGFYACNEMIGQVVYEENAYYYGEND